MERVENAARSRTQSKTHRITVTAMHSAVSAVLMLVTNPMRSLLPAIFLRGVKDEKEQEHAAA